MIHKCKSQDGLIVREAAGKVNGLNILRSWKRKVAQQGRALIAFDKGVVSSVMSC